MMRILLISDTHGNLDLLLKVCELAAPVQMVIHLGDGADEAETLKYVLDIPVIHVAGNCDICSGSPRELLLELAGRRLLLTHGDTCRVKEGLARLEQKALEAQVDIVCFGHTHQAVVNALPNVLAINPGTLMQRSPVQSFALLELLPDRVTAGLYSISIDMPSCLLQQVQR